MVLKSVVRPAEIRGRRTDPDGGGREMYSALPSPDVEGEA